MRKSLIVLALPFIFAAQAHASAFDSLNDQKLQEQALTLLEQNAGNMTLSGDVLKTEKLTDILAPLKKFHEEVLKRLEEGRDLEDLESNISHTDTTCVIQKNQKTAVCDLLIAYNPMGETNVEFKVLLDKDKNAVAIIGGALISRGD